MISYISGMHWDRDLVRAGLAMEVLGAIGPKAKKAIPAMEKLLNHKNAKLKKIAEEELKRIKAS